LMCWSEYIFALTIMIDEEMKTLTVGMNSLAFTEYLDWGKIMAYSTLFCIPAFILFAFIQKYLVQGLTSGAVKG
jgi:multiple sugar transport system permease protein